MKKSKSITPGELVKKHIKDLTHVITDDELANVKVGEEGEDKAEFEKEIADKEEEMVDKDAIIQALKDLGATLGLKGEVEFKDSDEDQEEVNAMADEMSDDESKEEEPKEDEDSIEETKNPIKVDLRVFSFCQFLH